MESEPQVDPSRTLQQEFVSPKSRPPVRQQTNVVYKIPCADMSVELYWRNWKVLKNKSEGTH